MSSSERSPEVTGPPATPPLLLHYPADPDLRAQLATGLEPHYEVVFADDEVEAVAILRSRPVDIVLMSHQRSTGERTFQARERLLGEGFKLPMFLLAKEGNEELAVEALRRGFSDYITRQGPTLQLDLLRKRLDTKLEVARLTRENLSLQRAIEESQARLFNIYDSLEDAIMQIDEECCVVSLNRSAAAFANREPREAVGLPCHELFDFFPCDARRRRDECHIYRTFLDGETISGERQDPNAGSVHQYMTFITTLRGRDYTVYRETDITEKRRLEERIASALGAMGAKVEEESEPQEP